MAKAPRSVAGKVVAITGAARGIGRATAAALVAHGARVAIGDIDAALAQQTAQELGSQTIGVALDVTDRVSFDAFLGEVESRMGQIDVVINNAGIMPVGPFVAETDATAQRLVDINLHGVMIGSKLALQRFLPRGRGHLVNIASVAGKGGYPGGATYCATKHAVVGLSEAIRAEVRTTDIDVSIVMPVVVNTELGSGLRESRGIKVVQPEDVANAILEALETGRVDVYVPRSVGRLVWFGNLVPRPVNDFITRLLKADQVLVDPDMQRRSAYIQRTGDPAALSAGLTVETALPGADDPAAAMAVTSAGEAAAPAPAAPATAAEKQPV